MKLQIRCNTWDNKTCILCCVYENRIYESSWIKYPPTDEEVQAAIEKIVKQIPGIENPEVEFISMKPLDFSCLIKYRQQVLAEFGL